MVCRPDFVNVLQLLVDKSSGQHNNILGAQTMVGPKADQSNSACSPDIIYLGAELKRTVDEKIKFSY